MIGPSSGIPEDSALCPHFSYTKADRRVTAYYFYLVDEAFVGDRVIPQGCAYFAPDGWLLASGSDDGLLRIWKSWDADAGTTAAVLKGHTDWVSGCTFSPNGRLLASGSGDGTLRVWNVAAGTATAVLEGHAHWVWGMRILPGRAVLGLSQRRLDAASVGCRFPHLHSRTPRRSTAVQLCLASARTDHRDSRKRRRVPVHLPGPRRPATTSGAWTTPVASPLATIDIAVGHTAPVPGSTNPPAHGEQPHTSPCKPSYG